MNTIVINQIIVPVVAAIVSTILELGRRELKKYLAAKHDLIEHQKEQIQHAIGIDQYNHDKVVVQDAVKTVEQLGKEFDWEGTLKHAKFWNL